MQVFILSGGFLIVLLHVVTVLLQYLIDCSIRVSRSCVYRIFLGRMGVGACAPCLDLPLRKNCHSGRSAYTHYTVHVMNRFAIFMMC